MTQPSLLDAPFQGSTPQTKHASWTGAVLAQPSAASQAGRILARLKAEGPMDRYQLAEREGLPVTTVCARLRLLEQRGQITPDGWTTKDWGGRQTKRTKWRIRG